MPKITISPEDYNERFDIVAARRLQLTRSQALKAIRKGDILLNGSLANASHRIRPSDVVSYVSPVNTVCTTPIPEEIPLKILYCDDAVAVIDKPAGLVVHPAAGHQNGTLINALAFHCDKLATIGGPLRPGIVHRLDKDTSGVLVVALDDTAYYHLVEQFRARSITRRYHALVYQHVKDDSGEITLEIGRSSTDRKKMSTRVSKGKDAVTRWKVLERLHDATFIEARLGTGRTHQIRVHFSAIGHPVLGDKTYGRKVFIERGRKKIIFPRQMLHAELLGFIHPISGEYLEFTSPLPEDMQHALRQLKAHL
jgi:23S rRNA pseudouridine1911/1915/1917 synthase